MTAAKAAVTLLLPLLVASTGGTTGPAEPATGDDPGPSRPGRLHWFIPDGMRADPELFDIFRWAEEGRLPNIRRMMQRGAYGYAWPTFPSHTPTNFATLLTGTWPEVHGVADGPLRSEGHPLARPSEGGFRSVARRVPAVWSLLQRSGETVVLLSVPGSTPPELTRDAVTLRGRWGGWGADFPSLIFERASRERRRSLGRSARLFFLGEELTRFVEASPRPRAGTSSFSDPLAVDLSAHGARIGAILIDGTDDGAVNYDRARIRVEGAAEPVPLRPGGWTPWLPVRFSWQGRAVASHVRVHLIRLEDDGFFRIRLLVSGLNRHIADPPEAAEALLARVGPMVDFVDNFPPQLIHDETDRETFLAEARMSLDWHRRAVGAVYELWSPRVFVHDVYTPNQMLTSRWWLGSVDPASARHGAVPPEERQARWSEVLEMYRGLDAIVGEALDRAGPDAIVVVSSDHGAIPLDRRVRLNDLFASRGWLVHELDEETGEPVIDWERTRVAFLKMDGVYIHPGGLGGDWRRASGPAYEALRGEVVATLGALRDPVGGGRPACGIVRWEDAPDLLRLPADRVGDLVVANCPGYGWSEELSANGAVFGTPLESGYKQALLARSTEGLWVPFLIAGPGVRAGHRIETPISMVDPLPTILTLLGREIPDHVQGRVLHEVLE